MSDVKFSVVIPTRERADTLRYALRTCLDQHFDNYEIIVSDNCSSPATKAVVDEVASPKVRYVRTAEPVAMSNNWEFALSHTRGEYVLLIGDDDGLLPHCLAELDHITQKHRALAVRWTAAYYTWPNIALAGQGNYLRVPLSRSLIERDSNEVIAAVAQFREFYTELPMLYNAAVHRDILAKLRKQTGRVFPHPVPDVYSGFAIAHVAKKFLSTNVPMTISGQSQASNGIATLFNRGRNSIDREFHTLNTRDGLRSEATVPDLPVFPHVPVADTFMFAKRVLFPHSPTQLDRKQLTSACVQGARVSREDWSHTLRTIRESLANVPELQHWFDTELAHTKYTEPPTPKMRPERLGFDGRFLHLDTAAFGITDVAGTAKLCAQLLSYHTMPVEYTLKPDDLQIAAMKIDELTAVCSDRERAILRLHLAANELQTQLQARISHLQQVCDEREEIITRVSAQANSLSRALQAEHRWSLKRPIRAAKRFLFGAALS